METVRRAYILYKLVKLVLAALADRQLDSEEVKDINKLLKEY